MICTIDNINLPLHIHAFRLIIPSQGITNRKIGCLDEISNRYGISRPARLNPRDRKQNLRPTFSCHRHYTKNGIYIYCSRIGNNDPGREEKRRCENIFGFHFSVTLSLLGLLDERLTDNLEELGVTRLKIESGLIALFDSLGNIKAILG